MKWFSRALVALLVGFGASTAGAQGVCLGCTFETATQSGGAGIATGAPQRHAAAASPRHCRSGARYCLEADATSRRLTLFENGRGVIAWDIIMQDPGRVLRGHVTVIDRNPTWCPTPGVRARNPGLPSGCLPPGHPQNAMGKVKISMDGDFSGTAIRIHDTRGFGPEWPNEDSSGCVRVLNLDTELLPRINFGQGGAIEVVFF